MSPRPEERLKEGMDTHEHDRRIHDHRPRWRNQAGRLHAARERRFELQPPRQRRRMGRAHPLERSHCLRRGHARLRQAQHRQGRSHLHLRLDGPDEVGEGWRDVLWRHARLRADRAPVQGPEPRRGQRRGCARQPPRPGGRRHPVLERFRSGRLRPPRTRLARLSDPFLRVAWLKKERSPMRNRATMAAMNLAVRKPMSLAEFLEWEERQELRYEFDGVEPSAMAGATATHSDIQRNLTIAVGSRLRGKPCKFHGSDLKILVGENSCRYPDGMVVCSPVAPNATTVPDPVVIFEVLSPSTAAKDRIVKAREYQATPSVKRYVMLEQARIGATVHVRAQDGWSVLILKDDDILAMPEIGLEIPLAEFYEGLAFEDHPVEDNDNDRPPPTTA